MESKKEFNKKEYVQPIEEQDFLHKLKNLKQLFEKHQKQILIGLGALAVIIVLIITYLNRVELNNQKASVSLFKISKAYEAGQYRNAVDGNEALGIEGLKSIVEQYSGTNNGELARIYLANCYLFLGIIDSAKIHYDDYSGNSDLHQATAYAGYASCIEKEGKFKEAAEYFMKAVKVEKVNPSIPDYYYYAGINFFNAGENEKALEIFTKIKNEFKNTIAHQEGEKYYKILNK